MSVLGPVSILAPVLAASFLLMIVLAGALHLARRKSGQIEQAHPPQGQFITVGNCQLHYRQTGDVTKPALLVLHGAASNLEDQYFTLADTFVDQHVIWLDRPGLGWSERPASRRWSPRHEAALIVQFLDALTITQATIIGHSWGGAISMRLAIDHPARVSGLVLLAPALSAWIGDAAWFNKATFWPLIGPVISRLVVPLTGAQSLATGAIKACHPEPVPDDYLKASALTLLLRPSNWDANAADMRDVNHHLEDQEGMYETLPHPTIIIAGIKDGVLWTKYHGVAVSRRMKNAELRIIEGAGHNPHHHHQEAILDAVITVQSRAIPMSGGELPKQMKLASSPA